MLTRLCAGSLFAMAAACSKSQPIITVDAAPPPSAAATPVDAGAATFDAGATERERAVRRLRDAGTLPEAIAAFDGWDDAFKARGELPSEAAHFLVLWAAPRTRFDDYSVAKDETTFALVQRDPDGERGKRLCRPVRVRSISAIGKPSERDRWHLADVGALEGEYRLFAVGGVGALVAESAARFCGRVLGESTFEDAAHKEHAQVDVIGMFDLPENRK